MHGCCDDKACTPETCMELPDGLTCGDCFHEKRCCAIFGHKPEDTFCDWFPRRFHKKEAHKTRPRSPEVFERLRRVKMDEKKYPIYSVGASWTQNNLDYDNGTGHSIMYKEDPGINSARQDAIEWWENLIVSDKYKDKDPQLISLECRFKEHEAWCLTWFSHYTFNVHLSDDELLLSFENFVEIKLPLHRNIERNYNFPKGSPKLKTYCLMGAEDRWRWKGPCHCEHCVKQGKTCIDH